MAGSIWIKNSSGVWVEGKPYFKHGTSGWLAAGLIYQKTGPSTWTQIYGGDVTPPSNPSLANSYDAVSRYYRPSITSPSATDTRQICIKISKTGYPTNPGVLDANSPTTVQNDGTPFWLYNTLPSTTSQRQHTGMVAGTKYYVSVWAKDASGNWSIPTNSNFTFPYPPAPTKTLTTKSAYVNTTDSASWRSAYGWRTDNNYVYQGGDYNYQGFWFYGTQIATLLKNANSVTKIEVYIQRVSGSHGIAGDGNIMVGHHDLASQPSGSPGTNRVVGEYNLVDLGRGEGKWATVTSSWYSAFKSGAYRGLGTMYQTTSNTSSYYNQCYGKGTSSGRIKLTWTEYV